MFILGTPCRLWGNNDRSYTDRQTATEKYPQHSMLSAVFLASAIQILSSLDILWILTLLLACYIKTDSTTNKHTDDSYTDLLTN